jgi:hypothetical protein
VDASLLDFAARVEEDELGKGVQGEDVMSWLMATDEDKNVSAYWSQWFGVLRAPASKTNLEAVLLDFEDYLYFAVPTPPLRATMPKSTDGKRDFLTRETKESHPTLKLVLRNANHEASACIPFFSSKPDGGNEMVALVGDSAHGLSPMGGT